MASKSNFLRILPLLLLGGILAAPPPESRAQDVGTSVVTAALGVPAESGSEAAVYITWWPTGHAEWNPAVHAIYVKEGEPDDPGDFALAGTVRPLTDPLSVGFAISRSARVGEDFDALSNNIDGLYDRLVPTEGMQLSEKLAAIIDVSHVDAESAENLALLTRRHPAAALAAGVAFLDTLPTGAVRTYEIRSCPDGSSPGNCNTVSGRVIVRGGEVNYLPAPGEPVHIPFLNEGGDPDPRGNLNIPLRWATPDALRERSFFQFGYDVYRVDEAFALHQGWDDGAPAREDFVDKLEENPDRVRQINHLPIVTEKLFSPADVGNLTADPSTFFVIDDNGRYEEHGNPFQDGDTFYYFVAGRDLLGRPGDISPGTKITVCYRMPPQAPTGLKVSNHYAWNETTDTQQQVLQLNWEPAKPREDGPEIAGYWIYRWESIEEMQQSHNPAAGRIAMISADTTEFIDLDGPSLTYNRDGDLDAPAVHTENHGDKTYWYTVRAIDAATCAGNISGNSAPAYGVLRDRIGPEDPDGTVTGNCTRLSLEMTGQEQVSNPDISHEDLTTLILLASTSDSEIQWIEFFIEPLDDERSQLGRFPFLRGVAQTVQIFRSAWFHEQGLTQTQLIARVGTADGKTSEFVVTEIDVDPEADPKSRLYPIQVTFEASIDRNADCDVHEIALDGDLRGQTIEPIDITMFLSPETVEWKLYRRVGSGPLTLLKQGIDSYESDPVVEFADYDLPLNGGRICYYLQVFDHHGNPSIMKRLDCLTAQPRRPLPQPMMSAVQPLGDDPSSAGARLQWFSAPEGVERFQIVIRGGSEPLTEISDDLRPDYLSAQLPQNITYVAPASSWQRSFLTGRVGANLGSGPDFFADWTKNLASGTEYFIRVRAIGVGGSVGEWSNEESFVWSAEIDFSGPFDPDDCVVPWPTRGLPEVSDSFPVPHSAQYLEGGLQAVIFPRNPDNSLAYSGGAVRVGLVTLEGVPTSPPDNWDDLWPGESGLFQLPKVMGGETDLSKVFYHRKDGTPLLNFMLFRYQVPNAAWPEVSGNVYQVSPLIERIAHSEVLLKGDSFRAVQDPYFFLMKAESNLLPHGYHLYIKDTQPVIQNAAYRYLVVRFDETGEIAQVIPLPTVTATAN